MAFFHAELVDPIKSLSDLIMEELLYIYMLINAGELLQAVSMRFS